MSYVRFDPPLGDWGRNAVTEEETRPESAARIIDELLHFECKTVKNDSVTRILMPKAAMTLLGVFDTRNVKNAPFAFLTPTHGTTTLSITTAALSMIGLA